MSSHRFGITNDTVGRVAKPVGESMGKRLKRRLVDAGRLLKLTHGLCLRAYRPLVQPVNPSAGMLSENPAKPRPEARSCAPRLPLAKVCGQESSRTPCVEPENSAR